MKLIFGFLLVIAVTGNAFSQDFDPRLMKRYSAEQLTNMEASDPGRLAMLTYALDNACYVADLPLGKESVVTMTIEMDLTAPLNYIELGLEITKENQYIRIKGTSKMLVVKSEWVLNNEMQNKR